VTTRPKKPAPRSPARAEAETTDAATVVSRLRKLGKKSVRDGMARYAIPSDKALGISVGELRKLGKDLGPSHALSLELWATDIYEARMLACFVAEPERLTPGQMDRFCKDFDNWAICDTACFHLFDRSPHAFAKVARWHDRRSEYEKRAAFALLASLALHAKKLGDEPFLECLPLIERAASDERNFVKKGVSWALRGIGARKSPTLKAAARALASRLASSSDATARWVGKDALRDLDRKREKR
jgi:3-methyladenine DNA glycosylase AlkD